MSQDPVRPNQEFDPGRLDKAPDVGISGDCCDVWWGNLTVDQKKYIHWYFRDMMEKWRKEYGEGYWTKDHQWAMEN